MLPEKVSLPTASTDQECGGKGGHQGLLVHRILQTAAREAGHRGHTKPEHGEVATADGAYQRNDRRSQSV